MPIKKSKSGAKSQPQAVDSDKIAEKMATGIDKLNSAQRKEFFKVLNTEHDLTFDEILKKAKAVKA